MRHVTFHGLLICFAGALAAPAVAAPPLYRITVISAPAADDLILPTVMNDDGVVAGSVRARWDNGSEHARAFRWSASEGMSIAANPGNGGHSGVRGIDAQGRLAAQFGQNGASEMTVRWAPGQARSVLAEDGIPIASNPPGDVLGYARTSALAYEYHLWTIDGGTLLIRPDDTTQVAAKDVNVARQVAGSALPPPFRGLRQPMVWTWPAQIRYLRVRDADAGGEATAINEAGDAVGTIGNFSSVYKAMLWPASGGAKRLGSLAACRGRAYFPSAINDARVVVGHCKLNYNDDTPFVWTGAEGMQQIGAALIAEDDPYRDGSEFWRAIAVNNRGQILVTGAYEGRVVGFVLDPVAQVELAVPAQPEFAPRL